MNISDTASTGGRASGLAAIIRDAANATGVNFDFLFSQASVESGLNSTAQAKSSSATGLYQFTRGTWLKMVEDHGSDIGLASQAASLRNGSASSNDVQNILSLRNDPAISSQLAARYAIDNARALQAQGHPVTNATDLYLAHFLGSNGAAKFLDGMKYTPDNSAADALPAAASANRAVFFRNGVPQSFAEVYQSLTNRLDAGQPPSQASIALASAALSQNSGLQPLTLSAQNKIALASATQTKQLATSLGTVKTVLATDPSSTGGVNFLSQIKAAVSNTGTATPSTQYPATLNSWQRAKPIGNTTASSLPISPETASGTAPPLPVDALAKFLDTASQWLPDAGALNEQAQKGVISRAATDGTRA